MTNLNMEFNKIVKESVDTLLNPKTYFPSMATSGGFTEPVIKAAVYGLAAGLISLLWAVLGLSPLGGMMWSGTAGITALFSSILGSVIALLICGAVMLLISMICGGNPDYEANVRVASSLMVLYPVNAFMAFLYGINTNAGSVVGLLISFYTIYLVYLSEHLSLKGREPSVKIVAIVLVGLSLLGFFGGRKATKSFEEPYDRIDKELLK